MLTAYQLVNHLRTQANPPLPASKVNYGLADGIDPPLLSVTDFKITPAYDTAGMSHHTVTFTLHTFARTLADAESLMAQYQARALAVAGLPQSRGGFVEGYEIVQEDLYVFHVASQLQLLINGG
jgi:hypothetical protein